VLSRRTRESSDLPSGKGGEDYLATEITEHTEDLWPISFSVLSVSSVAKSCYSFCFASARGQHRYWAFLNCRSSLSTVAKKEFGHREHREHREIHGGSIDERNCWGGHLVPLRHLTSKASGPTMCDARRGRWAPPSSPGAACALRLPCPRRSPGPLNNGKDFHTSLSHSCDGWYKMRLMLDGNKAVLVPCDLCGGADHRLLFVKEGFRHVQCIECGLVFVNPRLAGHLDFQRVSGTGGQGDVTLTRAQQRRLTREVKALEPFRRRDRILEIGPGRGWFIAEASRMGWETWAVEINVDALEHLAFRNPHRVIRASADNFDAPADSMDVVRMWDVIEHLESPRRAVARAKRVLRRGGILQVSTTNFDSLSRRVNGPEWVYLNGSDHIVLFTPPTMTRLLGDAGFQDIRIRTRSFNLVRKLHHPEKALPDTSTFLKPFRKLIDELIRLTMYGHLMIVTAVKP